MLKIVLLSVTMLVSNELENSKFLERNCPNNSKFNTIVFALSVKCFHTENSIIYAIYGGNLGMSFA